VIVFPDRTVRDYIYRADMSGRHRLQGTGMDFTDMRAAIEAAPEARRLYQWLAASHRATFDEWVRESADDVERRHRIAAAVAILAGDD
jgi:hypothetical protein